MKKLFTILMIVLLMGGLMAQQTKSLPGKRKCGTMENLELLKQNDPTYESRMIALENFVQNYIANHPEENDKVVITVPVVVHLVYNTTAQNLSDTRIQEQITVLNADYAGLNVHSMQSFSTSLKSNTELQFCLAQTDPTGAPTTGIERRSTTTTSFSTNNGVKLYSSGGLNQWDPNKYMNIWVCNLGTSLCGYAEFPTTTLTNTYGVVIHFQFFGKTGASAPYNLGGTTTHEIGHCFNLRHIWGDAGNCSPDDLVTDTPPQDIETYGPHTGVLLDACQTASPGIMYMNFMDYSDDISYSNFTPGQKTRIQACFAVGAPLRQLSLSTACTGSSTLNAAFSANFTSVNLSSPVVFTSQSTGSPTTYSWNFGSGASPAAANTVGPHTVTYSTAGLKTVSLTVGNGSTTDTETKTSYITVTSCVTSGYSLNFECNSDFDITFSPWTVNDVDQSLTYGIEDGSTPPVPFVFAHSGEAMAYLAFNPASTVPTLSTDAELQPHGGVRFGACMNASTPTTNPLNNDWLISPKVLLGTSSTFTLWVKSYTASYGLERFKIGVSTTNNSPGSFTIISTGTYETAPAVWTQKTYSLATYNNQQVYVGINCVSNDAFVFMVDDININTTLTGMNVVPEVQMINLFPNPATESAYVDITSIDSKEVNIELYDMFGKLQNVVVSKEATNLRKIDLKGLSKGVYIAKINTPLGEKIEKLVVY